MLHCAASISFIALCTILTNKENKQMRKRILQCYIWSTLLYRCETWTLTKTMESKLEAFEMWAYRRILGVSWTEHETSEEVLRMANTTSSLLPTIKKRKCQYLGHVIRARSIQKLWLDWRQNWRKERTGETKNYLDKKHQEWLGHTYNGCVRRAEDRNSSRSKIAYQEIVFIWSDWKSLNE